MLKRKPQPVSTALTHCSFCLAVEGLHPNEISARLEIPCDGGDILRKEVADISFEAEGLVSTWTLVSGLAPEVSATEHLTRLVARLEPTRARLRSLLQIGALGELRLAMLGSGMFTRFELPVSLARRIAALDVPLFVHFTPEEEWTAAIAHVEQPR